MKITAIETHVCHARMRNWIDRKSTRLYSSHVVISYAVFCLKKKTQNRPALTEHSAHYH